MFILLPNHNAELYTVIAKDEVLLDPTKYMEILTQVCMQQKLVNNAMFLAFFINQNKRLLGKIGNVVDDPNIRQNNKQCIADIIKSNMDVNAHLTVYLTLKGNQVVPSHTYEEHDLCSYLTLL